MGPPGSGKTTLGKHVASITDNVFFVSVGEYMRNNLHLTPPFEDTNRIAIFEEIIFEEFGTKEKKHLIVDCNPFPPEMWDAVSKQLIHFETVRLLSMSADINTLQKRLDSRNRKDHLMFSNKKRLDYYFKKVEPAINKIRNEKIIEHLQNETADDYKKCVETTINIYEKS
ncbi:MAG: hypothetical protein UU88_C0013G0006 [Parcubacteria group bacterium GW2011_GWC1_42_11]|uniref:Adenylate kinase n=1 Tax=Candidatus Nomurabacteria bacterium GW2011_GWC2_42_20 TaxID=1618756 RepID=A0A0G1BKV3_9BACT|nr:MAG: hypothetical protein UU88_C0013G0006 [Parcubacteria group bacterium GW2011_GWC1_42_11]KKS46916.1 MAG: hypothetical protein UV12_C0015G0010 [Candidatus Nomurabacteria bacterium GW2011_GWC2_42_20]KKS58920.1 MAG: hypothetical protein UV24_C0012G0007 [Candidatus Nomurabacteria bacterium GW2011_GWA2_42_41]KKT08133.1 MAG: hypothetical protein UV86_C0023G0008 [Candidatus Nomurabacteria bacterium GW2011_GWB1_43_20]